MKKGGEGLTADDYDYLWPGASYDSVPSRKPRQYPKDEQSGPPGQSITVFLPYAAFSEFLPERGRPIVPYLQGPETLEQTLEKLQEEDQKDPERLRQIAAVRFYLHRLIAACEDNWNKEVPAESLST